MLAPTLLPGFGLTHTVKGNVWLAADSPRENRIRLIPATSRDWSLHFELPAGEYEFIAGYGGGVHASGSIASESLWFDVDAQGTAQLVRGTTLPQR